MIHTALWVLAFLFLLAVALAILAALFVGAVALYLYLLDLWHRKVKRPTKEFPHE